MSLQSSDAKLVVSILHAYCIIANYGESVGYEDDDDRESLDSAGMNDFRFFRKLERYYIACRIVTSEVVHLVRHNFAINITVATVPILKTTSTPAEQNEYHTCEGFFMDRFKIDANTIHTRLNGCSKELEGSE